MTSHVTWIIRIVLKEYKYLGLLHEVDPKRASHKKKKWIYLLSFNSNFVFVAVRFANRIIM